MKNYHLIKSDKFCCVGAALETIFNKYGYDNISQYDIVNFLGLNVPRNVELTKLLKNLNYSTNPTDFGVKLHTNSINELFNFFNIPLTEIYIPITQIPEFTFSKILKKIPKEVDVIFGFDYGTMFNKKELINIGHVGIISDCTESKITFYDPGPEGYGKKEINSDDVYSAIRQRKGGFGIIKNKIFDLSVWDIISL